jgi:hypothetical protein
MTSQGIIAIAAITEPRDEAAERMTKHAHFSNPRLHRESAFTES